MSADIFSEPTEPELQTEYTFDALGRLLSVRHFFPFGESFDYIYEDEDAISHDGLSADDIDPAVRLTLRSGRENLSVPPWDDPVNPSFLGFPNLIGFSDTPGVPVLDVGVDAYSELSQEFELCAICLKGAEGPQFKKTGSRPVPKGSLMYRLGYAELAVYVATKVTVYGCVRWSVSTRRQDDGSYQGTITLGSKSSGPVPLANLTGLSFTDPTNYPGASPGELFRLGFRGTFPTELSWGTGTF